MWQMAKWRACGISVVNVSTINLRGLDEDCSWRTLVNYLFYYEEILLFITRLVVRRTDRPESTVLQELKSIPTFAFEEITAAPDPLSQWDQRATLTFNYRPRCSESEQGHTYNRLDVLEFLKRSTRISRQSVHITELLEVAGHRTRDHCVTDRGDGFPTNGRWRCNHDISECRPRDREVFKRIEFETT